MINPLGRRQEGILQHIRVRDPRGDSIIDSKSNDPSQPFAIMRKHLGKCFFASSPHLGEQFIGNLSGDVGHGTGM